MGAGAAAGGRHDRVREVRLRRRRAERAVPRRDRARLSNRRTPAAPAQFPPTQEIRRGPGPPRARRYATKARIRNGSTSTGPRRVESPARASSTSDSPPSSKVTTQGNAQGRAQSTGGRIISSKFFGGPLCQLSEVAAIRSADAPSRITPAGAYAGEEGKIGGGVVRSGGRRRVVEAADPARNQVDPGQGLVGEAVRDPPGEGGAAP